MLRCKHKVSKRIPKPNPNHSMHTCQLGDYDATRLEKLALELPWGWVDGCGGKTVSNSWVLTTQSKNCELAPKNHQCRSTKIKDKTGATWQARQKEPRTQAGCQRSRPPLPNDQRTKIYEDGDKRPSYSTDRMEKRNDSNIKKEKGSHDWSNEQLCQRHKNKRKRWLARWLLFLMILFLLMNVVMTLLGFYLSFPLK